MTEIGYAVRRLRASPLFTIAATLTLAIAIGATGSVFGLVDGVLLKAFPYRDPDRIVVIWESNPTLELPEFSSAPANFVDWRTQNSTFATLAASTATLGSVEFERQFTVTGAPEPERLRALTVTPSYFAALGLTPVLGRTLSADSAGPAEVLISNGYWTRRFGSTPSVIGQSLVLDNQAYTIVGVMPAGIPGDVTLWTRLSFTGPAATNRGARFLVSYGRLKPGVSIEAARRDLETVAARLAAAYPASNKGWTVVVNPLLDEWVGDVRTALVLLLSAAGCVLLIGAANLANLFLVRGLARQRELALRTAIGATRGRLVRELLAEAATLGLAAAALGIGAAFAGIKLLRTLAPSSLPRLSDVSLDARVVAFCTLAAIATVLIFGVLPAWQASRINLAETLKEGGRGTGSAQHHRLQSGLVVLQIAVALVLLTGAGLLVQSFSNLRRRDPGFRADGVMTASLAPDTAHYPTPERQRAFFTKVIDDLAAQPGIDAVSASSLLPVGDPPLLGFAIVGHPQVDPDHAPQSGFALVSPDYFRTLGLRLLAGRVLTRTDDERAHKVVVVDELLAKKFFGGANPVGQQLRLLRDTAEVVGEVATVKEGPLAVPDLSHVYLPATQVPFPFPRLHIAVRTQMDAAATTRLIKHVVAQIDPTVPVFDIEPMSERLAQSMGTARFSSFLAALFAAVALMLGVVGIYSVLAYIVSQRHREIAVRIAIGASRSAVVGDVLRRAVALTATGVLVGSLVAWLFSRVLANLLDGVSAHDPTIFAGSAIAFVIVGLAAAVIPAFRTTRIDPVVALTST